MEYLTPQISLIFATIIFTSTVFLHLIRSDASAIRLYTLQSISVATLLVLSLFEKFSILMLVAVVSTLLVKVIIGPFFFFRIIKKCHIKSSSSKYLDMPATLVVIAALVILTQTHFFKPLVLLASSGQNLLSISIATILVSLFLSVNRKGALSQMLGILSLENGIVSFALFAGLEQNPGLQLGITSSILVWIVIASVFVSMIFRQFGSLDLSNMTKLIE